MRDPASMDAPASTTSIPTAPASVVPAAPTPEWLDTLCRERMHYNLPARASERAGSFADGILAFLFPHFAPRLDGAREALDRELAHIADESQTLFADFLAHQAGPELTHTTELSIDATGVKASAAFVAALPSMRADLLADAEFLVASDPAATSVDEVILAYPGFYAIACCRLAHRIRTMGIPLLPRLITEHAHTRTGIDIHPGATIGVPFAIDHGTGIVIGETAIVEDDVSMLHSVTLGGTGKEGGDRHPKIRRGVMIGAGAKVLGNIEVGEDARIAAGSVVLEDVSPRCTVAGVPARPIGGPCCEGVMPAEAMNQNFQGD